MQDKEGTIVDYLRNSGCSGEVRNSHFIISLLRREEVMLSNLVERVSNVVLVPEVEDKLCWANDRNELFSIRKCSELLIMEGGKELNFAFDKIWRIKVPQRVRSFL